MYICIYIYIYICIGMPWDIPVNSAADIEGIRKAARAAREVLDIATSSVCNKLHHAATHCNSLRLTATHCNTPQRTAPLLNTL